MSFTVTVSYSEQGSVVKGHVEILVEPTEMAAFNIKGQTLST